VPPVRRLRRPGIRNQLAGLRPDADSSCRSETDLKCTGSIIEFDQTEQIELKEVRKMKAQHAILVALAAAAVMVAVAGITLLSPSSSASATARPGSSPTAMSVGLVSDSHSVRQTVTEQGVRFSFKVPTNGWERFRSISTNKSPAGPISLNKSILGPQGAEAIIYWASFPDGDYADPCARLLGRSVGPSVADLAAAVSTSPGTRLVNGPSDVTLGGHRAKQVVLTVRKSVGCDPGFFYTWKDVFAGALWPTTAAGDTIRVWIVAVGGTRLFIEAATTEQANSRLKKEIQQIVESIRFD
jgi:hypothetical protein